MRSGDRVRVLVVLMAVLCGCPSGGVVDFRPVGPAPIPLDGASASLEMELRAGPLVEDGTSFVGPVDATLLVAYARGEELLCRQRVEVEGTLVQVAGPWSGACAGCVAEIVLDATSAVEAGDPAEREGECEPGEVPTGIGLSLFHPRSEGGFEDLARLLVLPTEAVDAAWSPADAGTPTVEGLALDLAGRGFRLEGFLLTGGGPGSLVATSLDALAGDVDGWRPLMSLAVAQDTAPRPLLEGWFAAEGLWAVGL